MLNADGDRVHPVFWEAQPLQEYIGRNSTNASFFAFQWDGMRSQDNGNGNGDHRKVVPNGRYVLGSPRSRRSVTRTRPATRRTWTRR